MHIDSGCVLGAVVELRIAEFETPRCGELIGFGLFLSGRVKEDGLRSLEIR